MNRLRKTIFIINILLLLWLFIGNFTEFDLARVKNQSYFREQISEIDKSKSIEDIKRIAKSKVFTIQRIYQIDDERRENFSYVIFLIIAIQLFLHIDLGKRRKFEKQ